MTNYVSPFMCSLHKVYKINAMQRLCPSACLYVSFLKLLRFQSQNTKKYQVNLSFVCNGPV